jgi:hypothetical protein
LKLQNRKVKGDEKKCKSKGNRDNDFKVYTSITMERLLVNFLSNSTLVSHTVMAFQFILYYKQYEHGPAHRVNRNVSFEMPKL